MVDALMQNMSIGTSKSAVLSQLGLDSGQYVLLTMHRQENVDDPRRLGSVVDALAALGSAVGVPIIFPVHPRTRRRLAEFGLEDQLRGAQSVELVEPLGYLDFLRLLQSALVVLTDSWGATGGSVHSAGAVRDITRKDRTSRIGGGRGNTVTGLDVKAIVDAAVAGLSSSRDWRNPFGDGDSARHILDVLDQPADAGWCITSGHVAGGVRR